ncbi:MalM family protein [Vibrio sp. E150_011]
MRFSLWIMVLLITGCSQSSTTVDAYGLAALSDSNVCCESIRALEFQTLLNEKKQTIEITSRSPSLMFDTGKSFISALEISAHQDIRKLNIYSEIDADLFVPQAQLLDENFTVVFNSDAQDIVRESQTAFHPERYRLTLSFDHEPSPRYLIIYTDFQLLGESTPRKADVSAMAETGQTMALQKYMMEPFGVHSATGTLTLSMEKSAPNAVVASPTIKANTLDALERYKRNLTQKERDNFGVEIIELVERGDLEKALAFTNKAAKPDIAKGIFTMSVKLKP